MPLLWVFLIICAVGKLGYDWLVRKVDQMVHVNWLDGWDCLMGVFNLHCLGNERFRSMKGELHAPIRQFFKTLFLSLLGNSSKTSFFFAYQWVIEVIESRV